MAKQPPLAVLNAQRKQRDDLRAGIWAIRKSPIAATQIDGIALDLLAKSLKALTNNRSLRILLEQEQKSWVTLKRKLQENDEVGVEDALDALKEILDDESAVLDMLSKMAA